MAIYPFLMYSLIGFGFLVILFGGTFYIYYQYQLSKLTKYANIWSPWKYHTYGYILFELGLIILLPTFFVGILIVSPDLINVESAYVPLFPIMFAGIFICFFGLCWAAIGLRRYWKKAYELAVKSL